MDDDLHQDEQASEQQQDQDKAGDDVDFDAVFLDILLIAVHIGL